MTTIAKKLKTKTSQNDSSPEENPSPSKVEDVLDVPTKNKDIPLTDIVEYAKDAQIPTVPWVTKLSHAAPRENAHCMSQWTRISKRALDLVCAIGLLIVLSPVMLLTAILVKLTSKGPIIFSQVRVGLNLRKPKNSDRRQSTGEIPDQIGSCRRKEDRRTVPTFGKEFTLYKFRTMTNDAEKDGAQFAVKGDMRVTFLGWFLRKTRIDELPQLWNVIRGEMSMVGPRPERPVFIEDLSNEIPDYLQRLGLKPGLTGIAQVVNGYDNNIESFRRKVAFDLIYLQSCCVWNDLKILFRTIRVVLTGSGAL